MKQHRDIDMASKLWCDCAECKKWEAMLWLQPRFAIIVWHRMFMASVEWSTGQAMDQWHGQYAIGNMPANYAVPAVL